MKKQTVPVTSRNMVSTTNASKKTKEAKERKDALKEALLMYQHDSEINANIVNDTLTEEQKKCVTTLDKEMCPLSDMILTRVTIKAVADEYVKQAGVKGISELVGKTITNVPFMSTTKRDMAEVVKRRYDIGVGQPVCILVHTNEKCKGIDVNVEMEKDIVSKEIILARNQQFLIKKIEVGEGCGETYPILHFYAV